MCGYFLKTVSEAAAGFPNLTLESGHAIEHLNLDG